MTVNRTTAPRPTAARPHSRIVAACGIVLTVLLAACSNEPVSPSPAGIIDPSQTATAPPPTASAPEPAGSAPAFAGDRPPVIVPAAVAERPPLPWCGQEVVERRADGDFLDADVRECFLAAYGVGDPAEFVSDGVTVEGDRMRTIYRTVAARRLEVYYDMTADQLSARAWTYQECTGILPTGADPAGVPLFVPDRCTEPVPIASSPETDPTADELLMAERLVLFAQSPSAETLAEVPFADEVAIGLADRLLVRHPREALADPGVWSLDAELFRDRVGPFSALDLLARWDENAAGQVVREVQLTVGPHPNCASPPIPAPADVADLRRLSLQPVGIDTCLLWWTVDLFVDADGTIRAVALDLSEP